MDILIGVDWHETFVLDTPILETVLRGSVVYLALFTLLRLVLQRESGGVGITDLLVIVLIADAAQNAMAGSYTSVPDGLLLVTTIVGWDYLLNRLAFRFTPVRRFVHPGALRLVEDGRLLEENMRREYITEEELMSQLRHQGFDDLAGIRAVYIEGDGRFSVLQDRGGRSTRTPEPPIV